MGNQGEAQYNLNWTACDTDKILPGMTIKNLYKTKLIDALTA